MLRVIGCNKTFQKEPNKHPRRLHVRVACTSMYAGNLKIKYQSGRPSLKKKEKKTRKNKNRRAVAPVFMKGECFVKNRFSELTAASPTITI